MSLTAVMVGALFLPSDAAADAWWPTAYAGQVSYARNIGSDSVSITGSVMFRNVSGDLGWEAEGSVLQKIHLGPGSADPDCTKSPSDFQQSTSASGGVGVNEHEGVFVASIGADVIPTTFAWTCPAPARPIVIEAVNGGFGCEFRQPRDPDDPPLRSLTLQSSGTARPAG